MASQTETQEYEFERTLVSYNISVVGVAIVYIVSLSLSLLFDQMHGRYRSELGGFAREIAASQRERDAQRMKMVSVAKHQRKELRKSKQRAKMKIAKKHELLKSTYMCIINYNN